MPVKTQLPDFDQKRDEKRFKDANSTFLRRISELKEFYSKSDALILFTRNDEFGTYYFKPKIETENKALEKDFLILVETIFDHTRFSKSG